MPMTWVCHQRGTEVLFIQRLLDIGDDIIGVLDNLQRSGLSPELRQPLSIAHAQLAVRMTGRVKHASTGSPLRELR